MINNKITKKLKHLMNKNFYNFLKIKNKVININKKWIITLKSMILIKSKKLLKKISNFKILFLLKNIKNQNNKIEL